MPDPVGDTQVLCAATIADRVPPHLRGKGTGWVTAEYSMLPRATPSGRIASRSRASSAADPRDPAADRAVAAGRRRPQPARRADDRDRLRRAPGRRRDADGVDHRRLRRAGRGDDHVRHGPPPRGKVAAVSVGIVDGESLLDLDYGEDSRADVDFNVVGTDAGTFVEVQGTAEGKPFDRAGMDGLIDLASAGLQQLFAAQAEVLATVRR